MGDRLFTAKEWRAISSSLMLSPRQSEILRLIFDGKNDKQVAKALKIRAPTVRTHVRRLFERLEVRDRTQLVIETFKVFRRDVEGRV